MTVCKRIFIFRFMHNSYLPKLRSRLDRLNQEQLNIGRQSRRSQAIVSNGIDL